MPDRFCMYPEHRAAVQAYPSMPAEAQPMTVSSRWPNHSSPTSRDPHLRGCTRNSSQVANPPRRIFLLLIFQWFIYTHFTSSAFSLLYLIADKLDRDAQSIGSVPPDIRPALPRTFVSPARRQRLHRQYTALAPINPLFRICLTASVHAPEETKAFGRSSYLLLWGRYPADPFRWQ